MLAVLNSLNALFQPITVILVSKFIIHRALSVKIYISVGLLTLLVSVQITCYGKKNMMLVIQLVDFTF